MSLNLSNGPLKCLVLSLAYILAQAEQNASARVGPNATDVNFYNASRVQDPQPDTNLWKYLGVLALCATPLAVLACVLACNTSGRGHKRIAATQSDNPEGGSSRQSDNPEGGGIELESHWFIAVGFHSVYRIFSACFVGDIDASDTTEIGLN